MAITNLNHTLKRKQNETKEKENGIAAQDT